MWLEGEKMVEILATVVLSANKPCLSIFLKLISYFGFPYCFLHLCLHQISRNCNFYDHKPITIKFTHYELNRMADYLDFIFMHEVKSVLIYATSFE